MIWARGHAVEAGERVKGHAWLAGGVCVGVVAGPQDHVEPGFAAGQVFRGLAVLEDSGEG